MPAGDFGGAASLSETCRSWRSFREEAAQIIRRGGSQLAVHLADEMHYGSVLLLGHGIGRSYQGASHPRGGAGMTLGEEGLRKDGKLIAGSSEEDIYSSLGLSFVPPELREARGEIERRLRESYRHSSQTKTFAAFSMRTRIDRMALILWKLWRKQSAREATTILVSPIILAQHTMRAD